MIYIVFVKILKNTYIKHRMAWKIIVLLTLTFLTGEKKLKGILKETEHLLLYFKCYLDNYLSLKYKVQTEQKQNASTLK